MIELAERVINRTGLVKALERVKIVAITVTEEQGTGRFTVFLHGPAGQWAHGDARRTVAEIAGVIGVEEAPGAPTILRVMVAASEREGTPA